MAASSKKKKGKEATWEWEGWSWSRVQGEPGPSSASQPHSPPAPPIDPWFAAGDPMPWWTRPGALHGMEIQGTIPDSSTVAVQGPGEIAPRREIKSIISDELWDPTKGGHHNPVSDSQADLACRILAYERSKGNDEPAQGDHLWNNLIVNYGEAWPLILSHPATTWKRHWTRHGDGLNKRVVDYVVLEIDATLMTKAERDSGVDLTQIMRVVNGQRSAGLQMDLPESFESRRSITDLSKELAVRLAARQWRKTGVKPDPSYRYWTDLHDAKGRQWRLFGKHPENTWATFFEKNFASLEAEMVRLKEGGIDGTLRTAEERAIMSAADMRLRFDRAGIVDEAQGHGVLGQPISARTSPHSLSPPGPQAPSDASEEDEGLIKKRRRKADFTPIEDEFAARLIAALGPHGSKFSRGSKAVAGSWAPWRLESWERIMDANAEEWPMLLNHPASSWAKRIEKGLDDWTSRFKIFVDGGINTKLQTKEEESRGQSVAESFGSSATAIVRPLSIRMKTSKPKRTKHKTIQSAWKPAEIDLICRVIGAERRLIEDGNGPKTRQGRDKRVKTPDKDSFWEAARLKYSGHFSLLSQRSDWQIRQFYIKNSVKIEGQVKVLIKKGINPNLETASEDATEGPPNC